MILGHDITDYPVNGKLTSNGVQYSTEVETTTKDTDVEVFSYNYDLGFDSLSKAGARFTALSLLWIYFVVEVAFKADASGTASIKWKAQARNKDGTWVDLFDYQTLATIGTDYVVDKMEGNGPIEDNFNQVPFDFRILFQCDEDDEGRAKVKNSTMLRPVIKAIW